MTVALPLLAAVPAHAADAAAPPSKAQWQADVRDAMHGSVAYLDERVAEGGRPLAIVLDIDNTSLATHYGWPQPVRPTLRFARHAHALQVGVYFVTGRYQDSL